MDSVFYYPQHPPVQSQERRRPDELTSSSSSSHVSPALLDNSPADSRNANRKRVHSAGAPGPARKKVRKDDDGDDSASLGDGPDTKESKPKSTRGARACTVCRRLKMRCEPSTGIRCKRCETGNHECIFEESNRGKRSSKKHEALTKSLRKMERTLDTVLRTMANPGLTSLASGMVSASPSPPPDDDIKATTHDLVTELTSAPPPPAYHLSAHSTVAVPRQAGQSTYGGGAAPGHPGTSPKLHSLPDNALNPLGLLAEASLANRRAQQAAAAATPSSSSSKKVMSLQNLDNPKVGVANDVYFKPGPMTILPLRRLFIERQVQPEMLTFVTTETVIELFRIYFTNMNPHAGCLDAQFHTPALVCSRSPFLLTTISAIASKFYNGGDPELHQNLNKLALKLAFEVPAKGYKSVEIVQAYLLLALWGCGPVERYEHDRTWMLLGMAIRMATDLNLHRKNSSSKHDTAEGRMRDREIRNRERTWVLCFTLDRSFSAQMGKPHSIKEDFIIRNATHWCHQPDALPQDVGLATYAELQRIVSRSLDFLYSGTTTASGLQTDCDYLLIIRTVESQILTWQNDWQSVGASQRDVNTPYRMVMMRFYYHYALLVINSFGLENAFQNSPVDMAHFFGRCHSNAMACVLIMRDEIASAGWLRYSPDSHFVLCSYAVLSLLKYIRPEFQGLMDNEAKTLALVKDMADTLEGIAANQLHTPYLYSIFLRALLAVKADGASNPTSPRQQMMMNSDNAFPFNNINGAQNTTGASPYAGISPGLGLYTGTGEIPYDTLMDFQNPFMAGNLGAPSAANMAPPPVPGGGAMGSFALPGGSNPAVGLAAPQAYNPQSESMLSVENIINGGFWDSMLVPGFSTTLEGLSGGMVYAPAGSAFISQFHSPVHSRVQSPRLGPPHPDGLEEKVHYGDALTIDC